MASPLRSTYVRSVSPAAATDPRLKIATSNSIWSSSARRARFHAASVAAARRHGRLRSLSAPHGAADRGRPVESKLTPVEPSIWEVAPLEHPLAVTGSEGSGP